MNEPFAGDKKVPLRSPLAGVERAFIDRWVPHFPVWVKSYHLTLLTIIWTGGVLLSGFFAQSNRHWLWLSSLMLVLQWFTDSFDGSLGRYRKMGLIRWGYFMDHLLDYFFMGSVFVSYAFLLDEPARFQMFLFMLVYGGMEANAWLAFAATNKFQITYFGVGPTEIRLFFICVNTGIVFAGTGWLMASLPVALVAAFVLLSIMAFRTQRELWKLDRENNADLSSG